MFTRLQVRLGAVLSEEFSVKDGLKLEDIVFFVVKPSVGKHSTPDVRIGYCFDTREENISRVR